MCCVVHGYMFVLVESDYIHMYMYMLCTTTRFPALVGRCPDPWNESPAYERTAMGNWRQGPGLGPMATGRLVPSSCPRPNGRACTFSRGIASVPIHTIRTTYSLFQRRVPAIAIIVYVCLCVVWFKFCFTYYHNVCAAIVVIILYGQSTHALPRNRISVSWLLRYYFYIQCRV